MVYFDTCDWHTLVDKVKSLCCFWSNCGKLNCDLVSRTQRERLA